MRWRRPGVPSSWLSLTSTVAEDRSPNGACFGGSTAGAASLTSETGPSIVAGGVATLAVQVKGVAVLGEVVFGLPGWLLAGSLMLATTAYTTAGGMCAGLIAEAFQGVLMGGIALVLAGVALARAGGPAAAFGTMLLVFLSLPPRTLQAPPPSHGAERPNRNASSLPFSQ